MIRCTTIILSISAMFLLSSIVSAEITLIPKPLSLNEKAEQFSLSENTEIQISVGQAGQKEELTAVAALFVSQIERALGARLSIVETVSDARSAIRLSTSSTLNALGDEGYRLDISNGVCSIDAFNSRRNLQRFNDLATAFALAD